MSSLKARRNLIREIEKKRGSRIITYVTSDRFGCSSQIAGDVVSIIHDHILTMKEEERAKLDLYVYSRGGHSDVPWTIVSMFREYCHKGSFSVLIPYRAHSAATLLALGADEIVMAKKAELGPIDATITSGPYNPTEPNTPNRLPVSVEDVNGFFALLDRVGCERPNEKMDGFRQMTGKVHPLALGAVNRLLEETRLVGLRLLNTRAKPFTEEANHDIIRKLSAEVYSHNHAISRTEALRYLGLAQVKKAEDDGIDALLWQLYLEYRDFLSMEEPFRPEEYLLENGEEEHEWPTLRLACVESASRSDVCAKSLRVRRLRAIPPTVNISLQGIAMPPIQIGAPDAGVDPKQLEAIVQQAVQLCVKSSLEAAAKMAAEQLVRSLPQRGFEHFTFKSGWKRGT